MIEKLKTEPNVQKTERRVQLNEPSVQKTERNVNINKAAPNFQNSELVCLKDWTRESEQCSKKSI